MNRRGFILGSSAILAAPSIVRASSLMPVSVVHLSWREAWEAEWEELIGAVGFGPVEQWPTSRSPADQRFLAGMARDFDAATFRRARGVANPSTIERP